MVDNDLTGIITITLFQYSLCRVVLMVAGGWLPSLAVQKLSVLALSSRFDGQAGVCYTEQMLNLSVLALSSRFDGPQTWIFPPLYFDSFSTRSVESF